MRLTCPNCGARYEVDDGMIPPEGRDVQCSNCTTTWFQPGTRAGAAETPPPEPPAAEFFDDDAEGQEPEAPAAPRRELDPSDRDLLREEAAREAELRRSESTAFEHQDEMPLDTAEDDAAEDGDYEDDESDDYEVEEEEDDGIGAAISGMMAEAEDDEDESYEAEADAEDGTDAERAEDDESDATAATAAALAGADAAAQNSRRDLLPDIEEINSTLRATGDRSAGEPGVSDYDSVEARPRRRSGTRIGFALAILIFTGLVLAYANAPRIIAALPQAEPVVTAYVGQVDRLRLWINDMAQGALSPDEPAEPEPEASVPEVAEDDAEAAGEAAAEADSAGGETPAAEDDAAAEGATEPPAESN